MHEHNNALPIITAIAGLKTGVEQYMEAAPRGPTCEKDCNLQYVCIDD